MKKIMLFLGACATVVCAACTKAPEVNPPVAQADFTGKKVLVAYYSRSGNTAAVARQIAAKTGADLYEIQTAKAYPSAYKELTQVAKKEIQSGFRPELKGPLPAMEKYDVVFVGSPDWWGTYTPAVASFLDKVNWTGKTVVPFFTYGSAGMQNCESDMKKQLSGVHMAKAAAFQGRPGGAGEAELSDWLNGLEL